MDCAKESDKDGLRGILALFLMVGSVDCQEEGEGMSNLTQAPAVPLELTANTRLATACHHLACFHFFTRSQRESREFEQESW